MSGTFESEAREWFYSPFIIDELNGPDSSTGEDENTYEDFSPERGCLHLFGLVSLANTSRSSAWPQEKRLADIALKRDSELTHLCFPEELLGVDEGVLAGALGHVSKHFKDLRRSLPCYYLGPLDQRHAELVYFPPAEEITQ